MKRISTSLIYPSEQMLSGDQTELTAIAEAAGLQFESIEEIAAFVGETPHNISERLLDFVKIQHRDQVFELAYYSETSGDANYQGQIVNGAFTENLGENQVAYLYWDFLSACEGIFDLGDLIKSRTEAMAAEIQKYHQRVLAETDLLKEDEKGCEVDEDRLEALAHSVQDALEEMLKDDVDALLQSDDAAKTAWQPFVESLPQMLDLISNELENKDETAFAGLQQSRAYEIFAIGNPDDTQDAEFLGLRENIKLACLLLAPQNELDKNDAELLKTLVKLDSYAEFSEVWMSYEQARDLVLQKQQSLQDKILERVEEKASSITSYVLADQLLQALLPGTLLWEFS